MLVKTLVSLVPLLGRLVSAIPVHELDERANVCVVAVGTGGSGTYVAPTVIIKVITTDVVYFPVLINTYVDQNTVLYYVGGKFEQRYSNNNC